MQSPSAREMPRRDTVRRHGEPPASSVDGDQTILAELSLPDMQDAVGEIDVGAIETERFARTQSRARQQSDQRVNVNARWG